ncbi:VWA domain-containing protein [Pseudonocardia sp. RS11V-5]|uniref:vWA domain-containing protein n=1 Tax=Pseudonocardia terrae TaxID=2905831 RepID=UPI001E624F3E|nr:VWA domain-containing protein [Pseudonocardia terrae]MCE3555422.1 VWA domain-containing protein [Pseudonocardia terrae]
MRADLPVLVARFTEACRAAGLAIGPDRAERFARAITAVEPAGLDRLRSCAQATLVSDPAQLPVLERVFAAVFCAVPAGAIDPAAAHRGDRATSGPDPAPASVGPPTVPAGAAADRASRPGAGAAGAGREVPVPAVASAVERLGSRDFDTLDPDELALLAQAMRRLRIATPTRTTRRTRRASHGPAVDLRRTLREARRTGGDAVRLAVRTRRRRPRPLVVLCDISGSMEPYARALLQLLYCAAGAQHAEVFTFATRLTRLTRSLARTSPALALERAGQLAPDWSGGTRIGESVERFLALRGGALGRGAVVLVVSDGWDTGDPAVLGRAMARLRRRAHRVVWANPRTRHAGFRPLAGGMAAAWPYCDAVVSAHSLDALDALLAALAGGAAPPQCPDDEVAAVRTPRPPPATTAGDPVTSTARGPRRAGSSGRTPPAR